MVKRIDSLIGDLLLALQQLRTRNSTQTAEYFKVQCGNESLRQKLSNNEPLPNNEATGDCFARMLKRIATMDNLPYSITKEEIDKKAKRLEREMTSLKESIQAIWAKFAFSNTLKSGSIALTEQSRKATKTTVSDGNCTVMMALIEPPLSMQVPSTVTFKMNHRTIWLGAGVCLKNTVAGNNFVCNCTSVTKLDGSIGHGAYLGGFEGQMLSHSNKDEHRKRAGFHYQNPGEIVIVKFDPLTGKVTYTTSNGAPSQYEQATIITPSIDQSVYFCVGLESEGESISIVDQ